ncbi:hypothetical protein ES703_113996 [subsurface metagenome]
MCPVVKRISQSIWNGLCPFFELFVIAGIAGAEPFADAVGSHRPPFVMVAVEPGLGEIVKLMVDGYLLDRQMAVIIINGHFLGVFVVKSLCRFCLQEKIFIHKFSHFSNPQIRFNRHFPE